MWPFQILLLVLGSSPLWVTTEEASTVLPEDVITTESSDGHTYHADDEPTLLPTRTTTTPRTIKYLEDEPTSEPTVHGRENTTDSRVIIDDPSEKEDGETKAITKKGGLETIALVGIILGIVIAIGIIAGIIIAVVRKMSGRYSP